MDKLTIISGCLFLAADIFAIASIANPDWINTGESAGALTVGLVRQCQTIHGRDRTCIPPRLPPEWVTTLFFIIMGIISLTVTCGLLVASHWRREATKYARWIAFTGRTLEKWTPLCEKPAVSRRKDAFHHLFRPGSSKTTTRHVLWTFGIGL
ncbi:modulator of smoothened protein isoform 2 [Mus musculus]|uniref:modulator of smoothened protein isoform 2 precursor n=1 Tax=Mus musculus TaxID=10090 RepID=UPI00247904B9|nr:modulator of smoothened protein isoform 2 [Mus musculus]